MAPSRSAKRPKLERGSDDYVPGNIVEIELRNFMTYDRLVCRPGPRLNLVVGPNGSGKSSLVCAIALALAADPAILGRASSVRAFVKRGEDSGHVRLSLRGDGPGRDICITRKIDTNNKSEWLLDGNPVPPLSLSVSRILIRHCVYVLLNKWALVSCRCHCLQKGNHRCHQKVQHSN